MKLLRFSILATALLLAAPGIFAQTDSGKAIVTDQAKAEYPLNTCVVSGEYLEGGDMSGSVDYSCKEEGKPDRLVRFCCKMCVPNFEKDPAKYLVKLDEAAAAKAKPAESKH